MPPKTQLLLIPGTTCDEAQWRHQIDHLVDVAEITIADNTRDEHVDAMARRAIDAMPGRFAVAGLSLGGFIALAVMARAGERVTRLCLLDTSARPDAPEQAARRRRLIDMVEAGGYDEMAAFMQPLFVHADRAEEEPLRSEILAMIGRTGADATTVSSRTNRTSRTGADAYLRQQKANATRPDRRPGLGAISCPTLVVCGRQDALLPLEHSEEIAAAIPNSRLVVIEDSGHIPTMERPQAATALMRYWLLG